jgi:hypothetical protein
MGEKHPYTLRKKYLLEKPVGIIHSKSGERQLKAGTFY